MLFLLATTILDRFYSQTKKSLQVEPQSKLAPIQLAEKEVRLTGTIAEIDESCNHDGVCKVKVDTYWITTDLGGDPDPEIAASRGPKGSIFKPDGSIANTVGSDLLGMQVDVFARVQNDLSLSLYGKPEYYLKIKASDF